jgi:hypothetical protein
MLHIIFTGGDVPPFYGSLDAPTVLARGASPDLVFSPEFGEVPGYCRDNEDMRVWLAQQWAGTQDPWRIEFWG